MSKNKHFKEYFSVVESLLSECNALDYIIALSEKLVMKVK